jgi:hypothetical protein
MKYIYYLEVINPNHEAITFYFEDANMRDQFMDYHFVYYNTLKDEEYSKKTVQIPEEYFLDVYEYINDERHEIGSEYLLFIGEAKVF